MVLLEALPAVAVWVGCGDASPGAAEMDLEQVEQVDPRHVRPISVADFKDALKRVRRSVAAETLAQYDRFEREFGELRS